MEVHERANMNCMFAMLSKRCLRWLGHVKGMKPGRIPKDILYGELTEGKEELAALFSETKTPGKETSNCVA